MNIRHFLVVLVAMLLSYSQSTKAQSMAISWDDNIYALSRTVVMPYDLGGGNYTRRIYVMDLQYETWVHWNTGENAIADVVLTGAGTDSIVVRGLQYNHSYQVQARLVPVGSAVALDEPRPTTDPFLPNNMWTLDPSDEPYGNDPPTYIFSVHVGYGSGTPESDSTKVIMRVHNITNDQYYTVPDRFLLGDGHTTDEEFALELVDPGVYEICYELWYKDGGLMPYWNWTLIASSCDNPIIFTIISTCVEPAPEPKPCELLHVWPNPTVDLIHVEDDGLDPSRTLMICSTNGAVVLSGMPAAVAVDVSGLAAGSYVVKRSDGLRCTFVKE